MFIIIYNIIAYVRAVIPIGKVPTTTYIIILCWCFTTVDDMQVKKPFYGSRSLGFLNITPIMFTIFIFYPNSTSQHGRNRHLRFARIIHIHSHHCLTCNNDNDDNNNKMHNNKPAAAAACDVVGRDHVIYTARHPPCVRHNIINLRRFSSLDLLLTHSLSLSLSHT